MQGWIRVTFYYCYTSKCFSLHTSAWSDFAQRRNSSSQSAGQNRNHHCPPPSLNFLEYGGLFFSPTLICCSLQECSVYNPSPNSSSARFTLCRVNMNRNNCVRWNLVFFSHFWTQIQFQCWDRGCVAFTFQMCEKKKNDSLDPPCFKMRGHFSTIGINLTFLGMLFSCVTNSGLVNWWKRTNYCSYRLDMKHGGWRKSRSLTWEHKYNFILKDI